MYTSRDGFHWEETFTNWYFDFQHVAYGNGTFVAGGSQWAMACGLGGDCQLPDPSTIPHEYGVVSTNGVAWDKVRIFDPEYPLEGLAFGNGRFLATHEDYDATNRQWFAALRVSTNAYQWSDIATKPPPGGLVFVNGLFFLLHYNGVSISRDGVEWEFHQANYSANAEKWLSSIACGGLRYVGVGGTLLISDRRLSIELEDGKLNLGLGPGDAADVQVEESNDFRNWHTLDAPFGPNGLNLDPDQIPTFFRAVSVDH
jgi:hypothetical protein